MAPIDMGRVRGNLRTRPHRLWHAKWERRLRKCWRARSRLPREAGALTPAGLSAATPHVCTCRHLQAHVQLRHKHALARAQGRAGGLGQRRAPAAHSRPAPEPGCAKHRRESGSCSKALPHTQRGVPQNTPPCGSHWHRAPPTPCTKQVPGQSMRQQHHTVRTDYVILSPSL